MGFFQRRKPEGAGVPDGATQASTPDDRYKGTLIARGLTKSYKGRQVVAGVSMGVRSGEAVGLLGPNGAGKTTTVRVLTTLLRPDAGVALVDGIDAVADPNGVRRRIGLTGQYAAVEERLTARENMSYIVSCSALASQLATIPRFSMAAAVPRS